MHHEKQVQGNEGDEKAGNDEDVESEEARQRRAGDDRSSQEQVDDGVPDERDAARDRCADAQSPVRVLVEPKHLSGEGHPERQEKEQDPGDPGQLARILVRAEEEDLDHVDEHDGDHEVRSPAVQRPDEPARRYVLIQGVQAAPRLPRRRDVDQGEEDPGDDLQNEDDERRASEDVEPARRLAWHGMRKDSLRGVRELDARVEPPADSFDQAHDGLRTDSCARELPGVGISPASRKRASPSTLYRYSNKPRSGGPEAREPSA